MNDKTQTSPPAPPSAPVRQHRATFSTDKKKGGYLVRVEGPHAAEFVGREIPVTLRDGTENMERLTKLLWSGADVESGKPVALYQFAAKPREADVVEF